MGLRDRILDYVAKVFMPVPDHPARGGMTGEPAPDDGSEAAGDDGSEAAGDDGNEATAPEGDATGDTAEAETDGPR